MSEDLQRLITAAYEDRGLMSRPEYVAAVEQTIARLDIGELRVAEPGDAPESDWIVHAWAGRRDRWVWKLFGSVMTKS
jgi:2,3,4,5-tetrahydropyridine-2-carboxylate N-succinyltransferase